MTRGLGGPLPLKLMLVRQVVADCTTSGGAQQGVVMGIMAGDAAHHRALQASFAVSGASAQQHGKDKSDRERFHVDSF